MVAVPAIRPWVRLVREAAPRYPHCMISRGHGLFSRSLAYSLLTLVAGCSAGGEDPASGPPPTPDPTGSEGGNAVGPEVTPDPDPLGAPPSQGGPEGVDFGFVGPEESRLGGCNELAVEFERIIPTVSVLVDRSRSMFVSNEQVTRDQLWDPLFEALTDTTAGVIPALQEDVRFGFTAYNRDAALGDASCPNLETVPIGLNNAEAITSAYAAAGVEPANVYKWDTPTAESVRAAAAELVAFAEPGPKYLLLVTDGNPDRCNEADPQCGQDDAIAAVQEAHLAGVTTFVVGLGEVAGVGAAAGCWGRCGALHLQDIANAGTGQPVLRNTNQNFLNNCFNGRRDAMGVQQFVATYVDDAAAAGSAEFFAPADGAALRDTLGGILRGVRSCTFSLSQAVQQGSEATGTVQLDGEDLSFGDPNGWTMLNPTDVQLTGQACERIQDDVRNVDISFPCESYLR